MINTIFEILALSKIKFRYVLLLIILILIQSVFDLLGLGLIVGFISHAWLGTSSGLIAEAVSFLNLLGLGNGTVQLILFIMLFFVSRLAIFSLSNYLILHFSAMSGKTLRIELLKALSEKAFTDLKVYKLADIQRNVLDLVNGFVGQGIASALKLIADLILVTLASICIIVIVGPVFISAVLLLILLIISIDRLLKLGQQKAGKGSAVATRDILESIRDYFHALKFTKCSDEPNFFVEQLHFPSQNYALFWKKSAFLNILPRFILEFLMVMSCLVYIHFAAIYSQGSLANNFLVLVLLLRLLPIGNSISVSLAQIRNSYYLVQQIQSTLDNNNVSKIRARGETISKISVDQISIAMNGKVLINNLTTEIVSGEIVGITGQTGSGKSTLSNVLCGLVQADRGNIVFYNAQEKAIDVPVVAYLDQYPFIVSGTLAENIFLKHKAELSDGAKELLQNLNLSHLYSARATEISSDLLSGGEKQRINFIRSLSIKSNVLIVDEPSSSLDSTTTVKLRDMIYELAKNQGYIIIVITHDPGLMEIFDKIITLSNGETHVIDPRGNLKEEENYT